MSVLAWLGRLPAWAWLALALAVFAGVEHVRVARLERAAATMQEQASQAAIKAAKDGLKQLEASQKAAQAQLEEAQRLERAAAARTAAAEAALAAARVQGQQLIEHGTVGDVVKAGEALGVHPVPARRPR